jgi:hypothetical protein
MRWAGWQANSDHRASHFCGGSLSAPKARVVLVSATASYTSLLQPAFEALAGFLAAHGSYGLITGKTAAQ